MHRWGIKVHFLYALYGCTFTQGCPSIISIKLSFVQLVSILSFVVLLFPPPPPHHPGGLEDGHLEVLWKFATEGEEHRGTLPLKWLQKYCYSQEILHRKKEAARPTIAVRNITHAQTPLCTHTCMHVHTHSCTHTQ